jgi:HEAT repeat protein
MPYRELKLMRQDSTQNDAAINQLCQLLETGDEAQRCYSARAIAEAKISIANPQLNACLYHQDPDVVADAAMALAAVAAGDLVSLQDVARNHPDSDARLAALSALAQQFNTDAKPQIIDTLTHFARGRGAEDDWGLSGGWDDWWDLQLSAVQLLNNIQTEQNQNLFCDLFSELLSQDPEPALELALYTGLVAFQPQLLQQRWHDARTMTQRRLARAFATSPTKVAAEHMAVCLKSDDNEIKKIALSALAQHEATQHLAAIILCLADKECSVQETAKTTLEKLGGLDSLPLAELMLLTKQAPDSSLPSLISLLSRHTEALPPADVTWLCELLHHPDIDLSAAVINYFSQLPETQRVRHLESYEVALNTCLTKIQSGSLPLFQRGNLLRQLALFKHHAAESFPVLRKLLADEDTEVALRQPALEVITAETCADSDKWLKELLLGLGTQQNTIAVTEIDANDGGSTEGNQKTPGRLKLEAILAEHGDKFGESKGLDTAPTSTLAAIQQSNIEATLAQSPDDVPDDQTLLEMIDDLDDEFNAYSNIVREHLDTGERLSLNRKKIAKLPQTENKLLAIRALGHSQSEASASLLLEAMLGATPKEQHEIFQSLTRIAKRHSYPVLRNGIGAAGYTMHYGDTLCKQSAAQFLSYMPLAKALPLLLIGACDENEHVRVCSLNALNIQLESKKILPRNKAMTCDVLAKKLQDPAGGVRKLALQLLAQIDLQQYLTHLVELAVSDQESNLIAAKFLQAERQNVLRILADNIAQYDDHRQPLAIQLAGRLLAS